MIPSASENQCCTHPPHRVQGWDGAVRPQGDPLLVPVGVDVLAVHAALQPHEAPVGEEIHRLVVVVLPVVVVVVVEEEEEEATKMQVDFNYCLAAERKKRGCL